MTHEGASPFSPGRQGPQAVRPLELQGRLRPRGGGDSSRDLLHLHCPWPPTTRPLPSGPVSPPRRGLSLPQERVPLTLRSPGRSTAVPAGVSPSPAPDLPARPWGPDHNRTTDPRPHRAAGLQGDRRSDCGESGCPLSAEAGIPWAGQQEWPQALHSHSLEWTSPVSLVFSRKKLQPRVLHFSKTWARGFLSDTQ